MPIAGRRFRTVCASSGRTVLTRCICALRVESQENGAVYSKVFHEQTQIWTARVRKACEKIKESHILVVLEDQWPSLSVSTATVQNILGLMQSQENIGIVYLDKEVHGMPLWQQNSHFYLLPPETPYRGRSSLPFGTEFSVEQHFMKI